MGATTTISVFHHDRYRGCVVPAVRRLLRTQEPGPWLEAVWEHYAGRFPGSAGRRFEFELNPHTSLPLGDDLREVFHQDAAWFALPDRGTRERENVNDLFQYLVENCCLGETAYVGNNSSPGQLLDDVETNWDVRQLTERLGTSAMAWNDGSGGFMEGVRGWLDPVETADLARGLHQILLPDEEPDRELSRTEPEEYYLQGALFRAFRIRQTADRAWGQGAGVLWGNDLHHTATDFERFTAPHPSYATETVQLLARAIRDRREFDVLPVLADALQEAGCENDVVLAHCRDVNEHTDACWVADLILANAVSPA